MRKAAIVSVALLFAIAAVGCKDKCIKACEHVKDCTGESEGSCDEKCKDAEGVDKKDAKEAAKCILDLSCGEIKEGTAVLNCATQ